MKPRPLAVINAAGCLALTAVIGIQWRMDQEAQHEMARLRAESAAIHQQAESSARENAALRRDIGGLKDSIGSIMDAANAAATAKARASGAEDDLGAARGQLEKWQAAVASRDARIRELTEENVAARARLDEAVVKMKQAGAR